jgi:hypothetical protein
MAHVTDDGNWEIPDAGDASLSHIGPPRAAANLCLRCGVRIWTPDMWIHDRWHASTQ